MPLTVHVAQTSCAEALSHVLVCHLSHTRACVCCHPVLAILQGDEPAPEDEEEYEADEAEDDDSDEGESDGDEVGRVVGP